MQSQGLSGKPEDVANLNGDEARVAFVEAFKKVQKLKTQLDQYTDLTEDEKKTIEQVLHKDQLKGYRGAYLETAQKLREKRPKPADDKGDTTGETDLDQLDFEFVLFANALIDYDYILNLMSRFTQQDPKKKLKISREQLIGIIETDAKFIDERETITDYVKTLEAGKPMDEKTVRAGYAAFKAERDAQHLAAVATTHGLPVADVQAFVDTILTRMIFDGEQLTELLAPLDLGWRARTEKELALMADLVPLLKKPAAGREISGLNAYEG
jgi:type I restriction enzyme R subunit